MYKELIKSLLFHYTLVGRGRGILSGEDMQTIAGYARHTINMTDKLVAGEGEPLTKVDKADHEEAELVVHHIDEMVELLMRQEIV